MKAHHNPFKKEAVDQLSKNERNKQAHAMIGLSLSDDALEHVSGVNTEK